MVESTQLAAIFLTDVTQPKGAVVPGMRLVWQTQFGTSVGDRAFCGSVEIIDGFTFSLTSTVDVCW